MINDGLIIKGASGMAGELGHMPIPMTGLLEDDQPLPSCNCGQFADAESIASLTGITRNLLPYWLTRFPGHELAEVDIVKAAKLVRGYAERGDEMALEIFRQQAMAIGRVFSIAAKFTDPDTYFVGGGVIEAAPHFRDWFLATVKENTEFYVEQARSRKSRWCPTWTWLAPAGPPSPPPPGCGASKQRVRGGGSAGLLPAVRATAWALNQRTGRTIASRDI